MSSGIRRGRRPGIGTALLASTAAFLALGAGTASGAQPEQLIKFPGDGLAGSGEGRMQIPKGIAASPLSGDVYVIDVVNERIDEYTGWGQFVRAFGWDVVQSGPDNTGTEFEICKAEEEDVCKAGVSGSGAGQIGDRRPAGGIGVDPETGDVYATDMGLNHRVQKFSSTGEFLLMFGGEVDKTTGADVCTKEDIAGGDVCGAGVSGVGDGEFLAKESGSYLAVSPDGQTVYVGDKNRIQEFGPDGAFKGQIRFEDLHAEDEGFPESGFALGLAADPVSGDLYVIAGTTDSLPSGPDSVFRIDDASGSLKGALSAPTLKFPTVVATDSAGDVYVVSHGGNQGEILEFDSAGNKLIPSTEEEAIFEAEAEAQSKEEPFEHFARFGEPPPGEKIQLTGIAADSGCEAESDDLYATYSRPGGENPLAYVNSFGPPPQNALKCPPPPPEAPEIDAQYATAVGTSSAKLRADINPHYDTTTTYYLEYGTAECSEGEGGCGAQKPLSPVTLTTKISNAAIRSGAIVIGGLEEATTYHYRFVAENSKGTVRGEGGEVGIDGAEGSFTTFSTPSSPENPCPNQAFRTGFSARLTDCRAYELVSPAKRSPAGDVVSGLTPLEFPAELNQASSDGEKLAYSSEFAFGDAIGAPITTEYIATRQEGEGWSTHAISPRRESQPLNDSANIKKDIEEKAFTADLCFSWLMHNTDPVLGEGGIEGFPNIYRRDNCEPGADTYRGITSVQPPDTFAGFYWPEVQGFSADGSRTVFRANAKLAPEAPDLGPYGSDPNQLYEWSEGTIRFICMLPNGTAWADACSAGMTASGSVPEGRIGSVEHAVSEDGRRVYWTASEEFEGEIYLRENADQEQSPISAGKCAEPEIKACTYKVSSGAARFWTAAADGSLALYTEKDKNKLREFSAASKSAKTIAEGVPGVAGASEDLTRIYFISTEELEGEGEEGEPNLYLREAGGTKLVGTLSGEDSSTEARYLPVNPISAVPTGNGSRTTADGRHLVFASTASLTGYDNRDAESGEADAEIFLYDAGAAGPVCVSCNPSGARPRGRELSLSNVTRAVAALIPAAENQLYAPKVITEDGNRIFFNSFDSLLARDNNGTEDVYEWERAGSEEACEELGADLYVPSSGGCLSLISSGEGLQDSTFVDMSIENGGRDVFFKTGASLVPEDPGLIDIYDAREGGGLPEPRPEIVCEPGLCPGAAGPPQDPTPSSSSFEAPEEAKQKPHCPKPKHRVNGKCVKKKHKPKPKHRSAKAGRR